MSFGSRSLPPPTAAEKRRQEACRAAGCEACNLLGIPKAEHCGRLETHHLVEAGLRVGERFTVCLGAFHHRGVAKRGLSLQESRDRYGPNLVDDRAGFKAQFGGNQALLNGQDDRIGYPREPIPGKREQRLSGNAPARRKPSATARPVKCFHREDLS